MKRQKPRPFEDRLREMGERHIDSEDGFVDFMSEGLVYKEGNNLYVVDPTKLILNHVKTQIKPIDSTKGE